MIEMKRRWCYSRCRIGNSFFDKFLSRPAGECLNVATNSFINSVVAWHAIGEAAARRPSSGMRILLTSTPGRRIQGRSLPGHLIVSIDDVLDHNDPLSISPDILAARLEGTSPTEIQSRIFLSPDGRTLKIDGKVIATFKSKVQIEIMRKLVAGYHESKRFSFSELRGSASPGAKALRQVLGGTKWAQLSPFLKFENDAWGFEL